MTITSRYDSTCPKCNNHISAGTQVEWERGAKATHTVCPPAAAAKPAPARIAVEDAGVYVLPDSSIVKVQATRDKQRTYGMRWNVISAERSLEAGGRAHGEWVYEQGLISQVAAGGRKMTLEEAKAFIIRFGQCVRCSRHLKAAESVERGIGPVCITYFTSSPFAAPVEPEAGSEEFNQQWAAMKNEFAAREAEQERAAYTAEMIEEKRASARN